MGGSLLRALLAVALVAGAAAQVAVDDRILVLTNPSGLENGARAWRAPRGARA
jgi:hypothetical protein